MPPRRSSDSPARRPTPRRAPAKRPGTRSRARGGSGELDRIEIRGAREHNLDSVDVDIPKKKLVVMTGVSGSGKSSLAFDTLYAEGQRRYVESLSAYARQFLGQMEKPRYDTIRGLSPTISIEQKTTGNNPRSTVGTITEISDYLRVLWARTGRQHCHLCGERVESQTAEQIARELGRLDDGTRLILLAPLLVNRKGEHRELVAEARRAGWTRLRVDGEIVETEALEALDKRKKHDVEAVIDRLVVKRGIKSRLTESVETALRIGGGQLIASTPGSVDRPFSEHAACAHCEVSFPELTPQAFSFNSPQGMCAECNGLGNRFEIDPELVVPDDSLSIDAGALAPWGENVSEKEGFGSGFRKQILAQLGVDPTRPWRRLTERQQSQILYGSGERRFRVSWKGKNGGGGEFDTSWEGLVPRLMRRFRETKSESMKRWYGRFMANTTCHACRGARLRPESAAVRVAERNLVEVSAMTVDEARLFFES
ncbi:MAG TPA: excinuclease ABC subunit UvrA, partial [Myxococcota bacterium]|nr:excinuclease ABC subunit UvrA [Myxococcota bacterium]